MNQTKVRSIFVLVALLSAHARADAEIQRYTLRGTFDESSLGTAIVIGDQGKLIFKLDTSATDIWPTVDFGVFPNSITDLSFSLLSGSTGNYSGGVMTGQANAEVGDNQAGFADVFRFFLHPSTPGLSFPNLAGSTFSQFDLILQGGSAPMTLSNNTGDSLASAMNNQPLDLADYPNQYRFTIWADGNSKYASAYITSLEAVVVPEPSAIFLSAIAIGPLASRCGARRGQRL